MPNMIRFSGMKKLLKVYLYKLSNHLDFNHFIQEAAGFVHTYSKLQMLKYTEKITFILYSGKKIEIQTFLFSRSSG